MHRLLASVCMQQAQLAAPAEMHRVLHDASHLANYKRLITAAVMETPGWSLMLWLCHATLLPVVRDLELVQQSVSARLMPFTGCHVLCLGPGGVAWALMAVEAGVGRATVVCDSALAYKAAQAVLVANRKDKPHSKAVCIAPLPLHACYLAAPTYNVSMAAAGSADEVHLLVGGPVQVLITDNLDHRCALLG
jgi:hypothetical protein